MPRHTQGASYRPELDGIRTLAVAGVLLFHAAGKLPFKLWGGMNGVDLFFVLSGYLITTLLLKEQGRTATIRLGAFYARRALRLIPALLLLVVAGSLVAAALKTQTGGLGYWQAATASLLGVGNWFQTSGGLGLLVHTWSLGIEWQYYLAWPVVLFLALGRGTSLGRLALYTGIAAVGVAVIRSVVYHSMGPAQAMFWTFTRSDGVLLGSALALAIADGGRIVGILRRYDVALLGAAGAGLCVAHIHSANAVMFEGGLFALVVCFCIVIGHVAVRRDGSFARVLSLPPLPQLGLISYGIYLFHIPVFKSVLGAPTRRGWWVVVAALVTIAAAAVSYVIVERPTVRLRAAVRERRARRTGAPVILDAKRLPTLRPRVSPHGAATRA